ncbi:caveolin-2 [Boleophthalmus pectinirostris]|uniref:caveolin-2 n=1 Tax=Boleophthalmus pectinirostris TaxID=150288 RepID=UPI000A1C497A|nr:caveolin-2 [Boleophthalmus pectinirostris]
MISDECLVECPIDDDDEDEEEVQLAFSAPPPPEFASTAPTPSSKPPTAPATPAPSPPAPPVSRDPYGINQHLKVEVSDVLAEPASPHSIDQVWFYSVRGFEKTRVWSYRILSLFLAVPFAFLCGVSLGLLACLHVWFVVPLAQLSHTFIPCVRSVWICAVNILVSPLCTSLALCCSHVAIIFSNKEWQSLKTDKEGV